MTVDFPDWQAPQAHANALAATGVPLLRNIVVLSTSTSIAAGTTSAPIAQAYGSFYEGYLLEVIPGNPGVNVFACDLEISHLDASNNVVAIERVTVSNWQGGGQNTSIVRGRLLGTSLKVTVQVAASAWLNTIMGSSITADSVTVRFAGLQTFIAGTGKRVPIRATASGLLIGSATTVSLGTSSGAVILLGALGDYTGPVIIASSTGQAGGFTYAPVMTHYTVNAGTTAAAQQDFASVLNGTPLVASYSLPSCFNVCRLKQLSTVNQAAGMTVIIAASDQ